MRRVTGNPISQVLADDLTGPLGVASELYFGTFGVGGAGGSFAYGDTASGIAFGLTKNRLTNDFTSVTEIVQIVTEATGQ